MLFHFSRCSESFDDDVRRKNLGEHDRRFAWICWVNEVGWERLAVGSCKIALDGFVTIGAIGDDDEDIEFFKDICNFFGWEDTLRICLAE